MYIKVWVVSEPVNVILDIQKTDNQETYRYGGACVQDCVDDFLSDFAETPCYRVTNVGVLPASQRLTYPVVQ